MPDQSLDNSSEKQKKYILVVEDDPSYFNILTFQIKKAGFDVVVATDGKKALKEIYRQKPDLVILDLAMPVMSGLEVLEEVNKNKDFQDLKILVLTNFPTEEYIDQAKKYNIKEFLPKADLSIDQVMEYIKNLA